MTGEKYPEIEELVKILVGMGCRVDPCGSMVTCDPPPRLDHKDASDMDYLVEILHDSIDRDERKSRVVEYLGEQQFAWEGGDHYQIQLASDFMSFRRDDYNLIVTANALFARRHRAATAVCKRLNLMLKADRVALFQAVLYGNDGTEKPEPKPKPDDKGTF